MNMSTEKIYKLFSPGKGIDIIINLNSSSPTLRSSIIFECDDNQNTFIISQPTPPLSPDLTFKEFHITTLVKDEHGATSRLGIECRIIKIIANYKLSGENTTHAVLLEFTPSVTEINIRSAYRLTPTAGFNIVGKFIWNGRSYISGTDFRILDISRTGIGITFPKKIKNKRNPLQDMEYGLLLKMGLGLLTRGEKPAIFTTRIRVVRIKANHNDNLSFVGMKFHDLDSGMENLLGSFIHEGQLHHIRKITNR